MFLQKYFGISKCMLVIINRLSGITMVLPLHKLWKVFTKYINYLYIIMINLCHKNCCTVFVNKNGKSIIEK